MGIERVRALHSRTKRSAHRRWITVALGSGLALATVAVVPAGAATAAKAGAIQYTKNTVVIPTSTIKSQLISVSKDGATYTFKSKQGKLARVKVGSVMLLQDLAVRDVSKTSRSHGHFVVTTTPAAITDLIRNGKLSWNKSVDFAKGFGIGGSTVPPEASAPSRGEPSLAARFGMVPMAAGGITLKGKTKSYDYSVNFKSTGKQVAVTITISKDSPVEVEAKITGTLDNLKTAGNISINKGKLASTKMLANNLKGQFKLEYSAKPISQLGLNQSGGVKITLPAELVVPFFLGPVPLFLGVKVAFFVSAGFSSFDQELSGSYTLSYDGEGGFHTSSSGATSPAGVLKGLADIILKAANAVRTGPLSIVFGAQMPQLELGLGVKGLNVAGNVTLIGSTGIATQGAGCDTRQMEIEGVAGASASFFGFSSSFGSTTLFDKKIQASWPRGCGTFPN
jgi:RNase P/RNase MRP subunit p29